MWTALLPLFGQLLEKLLPDPAQAASAKLEMLRMAQSGELAALQADTQIAVGQLEVNRVEAASANWWVSGWRPFVGWICGLSLAFKFIGGPVLFMVLKAAGVSLELPAIDASDLTPILLGMLGLGGLRTIEKIKGAA